MKAVARIEVNSRLPQVARAVRANTGRGIGKAVEYLLTESNRTVPHDEGTLERSGGTDVDTRALVGSVYYDTPYAVRQHEGTHLRHRGKGRAKWLESTLLAQRGIALRIVHSEAKVRGGGR